MNSGRHAVVRNEDGQYAIWPGDFTVPGGWHTVFGPAGLADCRAHVEREWRWAGLGLPGPGGVGRGPARAGFSDTVHGLFRARAAHDPDAVALLTEDGELSYRELDLRSDRLAAVLRARGVGPERVVPVCLERGAALVTAWLGVLKAGGAFLPLDPAHPQRRLAQLVVDCRAVVVVAEHGRHFAGVPVVGADAAGPDGDPGPGTAETPPGTAADPAEYPVEDGVPVPDPAVPDDLAYLIYTSGTTGTPKGVPVTHRSLVFTLDRVIRAYELTARDRVLQLAALGFDTSLEQVFAALLSGATLVLGGARTWAPTELVHRMRELRLTVADLTPAYWHHVLALLPEGGPAPEGLRLVVVGGDTVHTDDSRDCLARLPGVRLVNAYGVTEAAVTSTLCEVTPAVLGPAGGGGLGAAPVPIGRPLPGVRLHLLDARLSPVRPGEKGEIYLGGSGLARGYWRAPGLTAEAFLPDPYAPVPGERMYRTGDAGRWRPDGQLEILGRFDDQVKVRGYRVDPAEVESVLAAHPDVRQARVAADGAADGTHVLTAYYTLADRDGSGARARRSQIRDYLAERLPDFMVPADFVLLDSMPLTAAGKIDRRRLPRTAPQLQRRAGRDGEGTVEARGADTRSDAPDGARRAAGPLADGSGSAIEPAVAHLWSELLGVEEVGPADDFFALGGNSLLAMEMLARARIMFGIDVTRIRFLTRSLLRDATLRAFATATQSARAGGNGFGEAAVDWTAEAELGTPVRQSWRPAPSRAEPAEILLTGATGFCGAHLLAALLDTTGARVHCLVRAPDEEHALERIRAAQQRYLRKDVLDGRVVPLVGDLAEPLLGLSQHRFEALADSLDAIHHLGGQVNFIYPYHQLRGPNVGGTREVVRLAGHSRGIPVHYLSTLAVLAGFGPAGVGEVTERTPLAHPDRLAVGYVESKWVAEQLLHNAAAAGLPVTVLRTNDVTGDLTTGVMNTGTEICALIKYIADSGSCPDVRLLLDFVPADRFSRAVAHIARHAPAIGEVYHITSPRPAVLADLAERLRARGHPVEQVPYKAWVEDLVRFAAGHPTHPMTPFVPLFVDRSPGTELSISEMYFRPTFPLFDRANTDQALVGSGIELPAVDDALLDRYLEQLTAEGFLIPPAGVVRR
ncbi:amino acid adenylation domain-containing protein [Kitasatospora sp. NBC_01246]|uniref:amino acid adenylation domain-containing protein n=1 Tax=Kitasatospora sp. NBC_01246 TaxID=2903570 RepID=UPI002E30C58E|nr:amino acid adenylation domain-containing protein [Kitasatospora sp. NBC_01246]